MSMQENTIILFTDGTVSLDVPISPERDTVWLTANQMALLFDKDDKTIRKHINNVFSDDELDKEVVVVNIGEKFPLFIGQLFPLFLVKDIGLKALKSQRLLF